jgi:hypothetical protein
VHSGFLIAAAVIVPAAWGVAVQWLLQQVWPHGRGSPEAPSLNRSRPEPLDYQI